MPMTQAEQQVDGYEVKNIFYFSIQYINYIYSFFVTIFQLFLNYLLTTTNSNGPIRENT